METANDSKDFNCNARESSCDEKESNRERRDSIAVRGLVTGYRSRHSEAIVTQGFDAALAKGELTCLLGPNGAGKSTLLKTLSGFIPPMAGEISIFGKPLADYSERDLSKLIGVVLTDRLNVENLSVEQLIGLGRSPYTNFWGALQEIDKKRVEESIALVGIENLRGRMVDTLSDGERQKTLIAKTLAQETPIIFLDEPTAFLDFPSKVEMMTLLKRLANENDKTIFLSTHDLELALQISDNIWLIDKNSGVTTGTSACLSADGSVGRYFDRPGVSYDPATRRFIIESVS